ncbi:CocE/NonD family hydrolase [Pseudotenacibaculum haliotis]|uniref:CocE/NonD family hydrolase n=1 Tax=Pseudotenacibaculum haliotis TaxID=1862138 RepID=A0ABW5LS42_9FLAO
MRKIGLIVFLLTLYLSSYAQEIRFDKVALSDSIAINQTMQDLAEKLSKQELKPRDRYRAYIVSGEYSKAIKIIKSISGTKEEQVFLDFYSIYATAKSTENFTGSFRQLYEDYLKSSDDIHLIDLDLAMVIRDRTSQYIANFNNTYNKINSGTISLKAAKNLVNTYYFKSVFSATKHMVAEEIRKDHERRYEIDDSILIPTKDGEEISAILVKRKGKTVSKSPTLLAFSIYAEEKPLWAMLSASKGYVGMIANTRGKRKSKSKIVPLEHENTDVYEVLDWISKQGWSNEKIGMYGGSYDGFTQWASMKHKVHPALKTIVPSVAIAPGIDYPMENNVLHNFSYSWNFYVTNNKYLDNEVVGDFKRWNNLKNTWYSSGVAFNKLDSLDGEVNALWNKYMKHPAYDDFWKKMIPYKQEFSKIDIPILTITGYYDDSQRGAMHYYNQHHKYVKNPNHYLLIGPYDHWTAQDKPMEYLRNYKLDKAALLNIRYDLVYEWFDYILKGKEKPGILKDKVNFQVMDANTWMHKPSLAAMTNDTLRFHLSANKKGDLYSLESQANDSKVVLTVDYKDRKHMSNTEYYPWPLEREKINLKDGLIFKSDVLQEDVIMNGSFFGNLEFSINKKDVDYSVIVYQLTPEGKYFHLSYYIGRASFAKNREHRNLLTPNALTQIPFSNSKIVSKKLEKGSSIVIVININKNNNAQINYGTGKDVNTESIKDAATPLKITFSGKSSISLPIWEK